MNSSPARIAGALGPGWHFFKDHPYKVDPEPYKSLPATFPSYCKLMESKRRERCSPPAPPLPSCCYSLKGTSREPPSTGLGVPQVPGVPLVRLRPEQASPVVHVPVPPVPQHDCPEPPQVAQTLPEAASTHSCGDVHAVTPLSAAPGPPPVGQQS